MTPPEYEFVTIEQEEHGQIAVLKYNRPRSGNSLHPRLVAEMLSALRWADSQPQVRIIIQTGEGKFFCTGMELLNTEAPMSFALGSDFHQLNRTLIASEKILIAAVNGPAAGYGVSSLALFDLVYCVPDAYLFTPFVKWGMATEGASSFTFSRLMGHQKAAALCLAGEQISAEEAERLHIVTKILPRDGFLSQVVDAARKLANMPQGALKTTKKLMKAPVLESLHEANDRECAIIHKERFGFEEYTEAIRQFRIDQEQKRRSNSKL